MLSQADGQPLVTSPGSKYIAGRERAATGCGFLAPGNQVSPRDHAYVALPVHSREASMASRRPEEMEELGVAELSRSPRPAREDSRRGPGSFLLETLGGRWALLVCLAAVSCVLWLSRSSALPILPGGVRHSELGRSGFSNKVEMELKAADKEEKHHDKHSAKGDSTKERHEEHHKEHDEELPIYSATTTTTTTTTPTTTPEGPGQKLFSAVALQESFFADTELNLTSYAAAEVDAQGQPQERCAPFGDRFQTVWCGHWKGNWSHKKKGPHCHHEVSVSTKLCYTGKAKLGSVMYQGQKDTQGDAQKGMLTVNGCTYLYYAQYDCVQTTTTHTTTSTKTTTPDYGLLMKQQEDKEKQDAKRTEEAFQKLAQLPCKTIKRLPTSHFYSYGDHPADSDATDESGDEDEDKDDKHKGKHKGKSTTTSTTSTITSTSSTSTTSSSTSSTTFAEYCLDAVNRCLDGHAAVKKCGSDETSQLWSYAPDSGLILNQNGFCLTAPPMKSRRPKYEVFMRPCSPYVTDVYQSWTVDEEKGHIMHDGLCLYTRDEGEDDALLYLKPCDAELKLSGRWVLQRFALEDTNQCAKEGPPEKKAKHHGNATHHAKASKWSCNTCSYGSFPKPGMPGLATDHNGLHVGEACFTNPGGRHLVHIIGDWGGIVAGGVPHPAPNWKNLVRPRGVNEVDHDAQQRVASQMKKRVTEVGRPDYILNVGDNFYWGGITTHCGQPMSAFVNTGQWDAAYHRIYDGELQGIQWLGVLGNHDYGGFTYSAGWDQQIAYTWHDPTGMWFMPAQYWSSRVNYPDFSVDYFFIDTNVHDVAAVGADPNHNMCSGQHGGGNCGATGPTGPGDCVEWFKKLWVEETAWLEAKLSRSTADWQIIVTHFPPSWGQEYWAELSEKHGIDLVVAGHVHAQGFRYQQKGDPMGDTAWIISGGGGGISSESMPNPTGDDKQYGFFELQLSKTTIEVSMITHGGVRNIHEFVTPRPRREEIAEEA